ncbi:Mediator of RNA polymerase II transcription subunit 31 [Yarrowia sp. C11]|nr:Mediator of RNA polymerase II transcription subunit 31 [Yarrowia sp. E02]KAG5365089.1 Mediator of RNA polymerase II transcription subunit 31 [Yarrowia sp. C11]
MAEVATAEKPVTEGGEDASEQTDRSLRFEAELEFVQSLANPQYLSYLAHNKYLESPEFLNYLSYLEYWREPKYARFLVYPNSLHVLKLLQYATFRKEISRPDFAKQLMDEFYYAWIKPSETGVFGDDDTLEGLKREGSQAPQGENNVKVESKDGDGDVQMA